MNQKKIEELKKVGLYPLDDPSWDRATGKCAFAINMVIDALQAKEEPPDYLDDTPRPDIMKAYIAERERLSYNQAIEDILSLMQEKPVMFHVFDESYVEGWGHSTSYHRVNIEGQLKNKQ